MLQLSMMQIFIMLGVIILLGSIIQAYLLKDKIYCTIIQRDKTEINRYEKLKAGKIVYQGCYYHILPDRISTKFVWVGIVPTTVKCMKWKWDSKWPLDTNTWRNDMERPEDAAALDNTEDLRSLLETQSKSTFMGAKGGSSKKSLLESITPIITIAGILIIGYMCWKMQQQIDNAGFAVNIVQQQLVDLQKALGK